LVLLDVADEHFPWAAPFHYSIQPCGPVQAARHKRLLNRFLTLRQINGIREVLDLLNAISVDHPQFVSVRSELKDFNSCVTPFSLTCLTRRRDALRKATFGFWRLIIACFMRRVRDLPCSDDGARRGASKRRTNGRQRRMSADAPSVRLIVSSRLFSLHTRLRVALKSVP